MKEFFKQALRRLPDHILSCIRPGFYLTQYAMHGEPNLETAYGAMVFREVLHGPHFKVATFVRENGHDRFVKSMDGPTIADMIDGFKRAIATLYGRAVLDNRGRWLGYYSQFFRYLLGQFRLVLTCFN